ncbi:MAG: hypothetical protein IPG43_04765 [Proteobacteria bacterium]|nr:hypothetical protein [Pseudomonadota bacterium]
MSATSMSVPVMASSRISATSGQDLFRKSLRFCAWTGFAAVVLFIIGGVILGGMIPPLLHANDLPEVAVRKLTENLLQIRVGSVFMLASFALFGTFGAGIAAQTRRFETHPVFSYIQIVFTAGGTTIALLVAFGWALMVFRPDTYHPSIMLMWADFAYFLALFSVPLFGGWCVMIALPIFFAEEGQAPFPRWVAYVNLWAALLYCPGQLVLFFKDGPFSWHGIVSLWIPYIAYFGWIWVMSWAMLRVAKADAYPTHV